MCNGTFTEAFNSHNFEIWIANLVNVHFFVSWKMQTPPRANSERLKKFRNFTMEDFYCAPVCTVVAKYRWMALFTSFGSPPISVSKPESWNFAYRLAPHINAKIFEILSGELRYGDFSIPGKLRSPCLGWQGSLRQWPNCILSFRWRTDRRTWKFPCWSLLHDMRAYDKNLPQ